MRKHRSDSILKNLPEERQEQVYLWICDGGLEHAKAQLAADGVKVSISSLSEFRPWYQIKQRFAQAESVAQDVEELIKRQFPEATADKIAAMGQLIFTAQAAQSADSEEFRDMEYLRLAKQTAATRARQKEEEIALKKEKAKRDEEMLRLQRLKVQRESCRLFIAWAEDEKAKEVLNSGASQADKIEALGRALFGDDWEAGADAPAPGDAAHRSATREETK